MDTTTMHITELGRRAGVTTPTLRYYEEKGLIRPDARTEAGYRVYTEDAVCRLEFIRRAKALGLTLQEIRRLVQDPTDAATDLTRLRHAIAHKLADTRRRIGELEALRTDLEEMHERLSSGKAAPCGHIGDCECWLPTGKEVKQMMADAETAGCPCCGCTCPSDGTCSCCGCSCPQP